MDTGRRRRRVHVDDTYQDVSNDGPEHTNPHTTHERRRRTLPLASENREAGPSTSAEAPVPYLRTRSYRDPLLADSVVHQDSFSGFSENSDVVMRSNHTLNRHPQLRSGGSETEHAGRHTTHRRRRRSLPIASENSEAGPSASAEALVPCLRTRSYRDPLLAASVLHQDTSSAMPETSDVAIRSNHTVTHHRQLRKLRVSLLTIPIVSPVDCPNRLNGTATVFLCSTLFLSAYELMLSSLLPHMKHMFRPSDRCYRISFET